jgi:hypothetical protein
MGIINTSSFSKDLWPGVRTWYGKKYNEYPVEFLDVFTKFTSDMAFEEEVGISGMGLAQMKTEGAGIAYDEMRQGFTTRYTHATYALGFQVTREAYEDGIAVMQSLRKAQSLAFSMRQTKETLAALVLNRAFTSTYAGGDGKELCATDHPNVAGGTWSNELATAADLSEASLEQMCIQVAAFTNDRGMKIAVRPQKLVIPPALEFEAARILKSIQQAGTANNDINAIKAMGKFPGGVAVNHYLTDDDAYFVLTDCPDGLKYFERRADSFAEDSDWETEVAKFKAAFRASWGWTDPRCIIGTAGA